MSRPRAVDLWFPVLCAVILLTATPAAAAPEGTLTFALHFSPVTRWLDPAEGESTITPFLLLYALHDGLLKPMAGSGSAPSLAESWSMSRDGLSAEFILRPGIKFHNGEPVTADDVKFSFERYRGGAAKILKDSVKEIQILAPNRLRFVLKEPWPDFPAFYGTFVASAGWVVPRKYVERVGEEGFRKAPIGAGPYKFVSFNPGVELVLEAFEGYWRKTPSIKRLVFRSLPDETTRAAALKSGEVDVAFLLSGPTAEDIRRTPGLRLVAPLLGIFWLDFPDQWDPKSPWADRRVRLAASLAVDRQALSQAETLGFSRPTGSIVPRDFEFALPIDAPPYDPRRARQLLAEAGHPNGFDGGEMTPFPPYSSMGETIMGWLQAVGIRTRMRTLERGAFMTSWREKKLHGVVLTVSGVSGNAATRLESFVTKNGAFAFGALPEVDDLFRRQAKEMDRKKREALLFQMQRILNEQTTQAPVYHLGFPTGLGPRVEDILAHAIPGFYMSPYEDLKLKKP
ncbi:MAG TPA: ABC transporter substrate-binding protein [Methylomirabilota bacterium]|nr:ABC transporter substrate-binding protein [Methylomirabilota bacterium]